VFRYVAGKQDWFANGLPRAGTAAAGPRAGDLARPDVPTCSLTAHAGEVAAQVRDGGWAGCVVLNERRVVLGWLPATALAADLSTPVEEIMQEGPRTIRPDLRLEDALPYLRKRATVLVTDSDGVLVGLLERSAVNDALQAEDEKNKVSLPSHDL